MARAPIDTNGVDLDSDAPPGGDMAIVGDPSGDGHQIIPDGETGEEDDSWDLPEGKRGKTKERRSDTADDAGFDEEDARLAYTDSDDPDDTPARRAGRRSQRNARRREFKAAADAEISALRSALDEQGKVIKSLVTGQSSLAVNTVSSEISQLEGHLRIVNEEKATAVKNSDGDNYEKAEAIRDRIIERLAVLRAQKGRMDAMVAETGREDETPQRQAQPQPRVDPRVVQAVETHFERFCERFPWFDPEGDDADCDAVRLADARLVRQGYQRHTPAFWQEMERTLATRYKLLPERGDDQQDAELDERPSARRQAQRETSMNRGGQRPPVNGARSGTGGRGGFHLDANRTSLLREEGLDGPNLSKEDVAKRDRIIGKWRAGDEALRRSGVR